MIIISVGILMLPNNWRQQKLWMQPSKSILNSFSVPLFFWIIVVIQNRREPFLGLPRLSVTAKWPEHTTSTEQSTPYEREPSACLSSYVEWLAVFLIREQEHKSSISKKYRTETLGLKIEVCHLVLSLYRGKAILGMAQSFCVSFLCNVCFLFTLFLV